MANQWEVVLENVYGTANIVKASNGSPYAKSWNVSFSCDNQQMELKLHFYNKPKSKDKQSKILVQGRSQYALYKYVF